MGIKRINGIITPLLTPLNADESINFRHLDILIDYVIEGGVDSIFIMGSTGEFARFPHETRSKIIKKTVERVDHRVPVYAGISDTGLELALRNLENAETSGVDVIVSTLPYYYPVQTQEEALEYFTNISQKTSLPIVVYNIPSTCSVNISLSLLDEIFKLKNIIGIKDSSGDPDRLTELINRYKQWDKEISVVVGSEELCLIGLKSGADGLVPSLSNPFPRLFSSIYNASQNKDYHRLSELCSIVSCMNKLNSYSSSWMSPNIWRKRALAHLGICNDYCTRPYIIIDQATDSKIIDFISTYMNLYPEAQNALEKHKS